MLEPPPPHPAVNAIMMHVNVRNAGPKRSFEFPVVRAYVFEVVISPFRMTFLVRPRWDERTPRRTRSISETSSITKRFGSVNAHLRAYLPGHPPV